MGTNTHISSRRERRRGPTRSMRNSSRLPGVGSRATSRSTSSWAVVTRVGRRALVGGAQGLCARHEVAERAAPVGGRDARPLQWIALLRPREPPAAVAAADTGMAGDGLRDEARVPAARAAEAGGVSGRGAG